MLVIRFSGFILVISHSGDFFLFFNVTSGTTRHQEIESHVCVTMESVQVTFCLSGPSIHSCCHIVEP